MTSSYTGVPDSNVLQDTVTWLERAVIGLNLCPFAKSVHVKGQIHYVVSRVRSVEKLRTELIRELMELVDLDAEVRDTTLLIVPDCLLEFLDFNDFLTDAERALVELDLDGIIQIASMHPHYQFAGTEAHDIANFTNRSPYPILHLLREESIDRAVQAFPEAKTIYERNMLTMERIGHAGWAALGVGGTRTPMQSDSPPNADE